MVYFDELAPAYRGGVTISKSKFIDEHNKLLHILKRGTKQQRLKEAKDQAEELAVVMRGGAKAKTKALGAGKRAVVQGYVKKLRAFFKPYGLSKKDMSKIVADFKKVLDTVHSRRPDLTIKEFKEKAQSQFEDDTEMEENEGEEDDEDAEEEDLDD